MGWDITEIEPSLLPSPLHLFSFTVMKYFPRKLVYVTGQNRGGNIFFLNEYSAFSEKFLLITVMYVAISTGRGS